MVEGMWIRAIACHTGARELSDIVVMIDDAAPKPGKRGRTGSGRLEDRPMSKRVPLPAQVAAIYRATRELEALYPQRKFTPDGHLVGSIGEVVAAEALGLTLYRCPVLGTTRTTPTAMCKSR